MTVLNTQTRKVMPKTQVLGLVRYGAVAGGVLLWATHPYGIDFVTTTIKDTINPPPPPPVIE
eukprot:CAMPEP_0196736286 /NCGR_PEP_ID=MMETSP1091-20130531/14402_1 /TAXON_ID=302021 /ORGANISM="Rhodomonas sp., Strain CCMP768" /LENGTH=61 /DNA_ID=CAMNT_0042079997 /DNA_START=110 /DNA_END=295 /DNA_ORIENTATION=-